VLVMETVTGTGEPFKFKLAGEIDIVQPGKRPGRLEGEKLTGLGVFDDGVTWNVVLAICPAVTVIGTLGGTLKSGMLTLINVGTLLEAL
jgi:hypothetical protein